MPGYPLLDPKLDVIFKRLFVDAPDLLDRSLQLHLIELPKADRLHPSQQCSGRLDRVSNTGRRIASCKASNEQRQ